MNNNLLQLNMRYVLAGLLVILGGYLFIDHGQHLLSYLPFTFLLGCLVMHIFMHGSHRDHTGHGHGTKK